MIGSLEKELEEIVEKSLTLQNKEVWMDVASALARYEKNKMEMLKQEIFNSYQIEDDKEWNIHVMLLPLNETLPKEYEYVSSEDEDAAVCGYLEGRYEICKTLFQKEFQGHYMGRDGVVHKITYQLIRSEALLEAEKLICKFAAFYHLTVPLIYAPFFRRFVKVEIVQQNSLTEDEKKSLNLEISQDPVLEQCFRQNVRAIWNVSFHDNLTWDKQEIPVEKSFRTEYTYHHRCTLLPNEFLWFRSEPHSAYDITMEKGTVSIITSVPVLEDVEKMVIGAKHTRFSYYVQFDRCGKLPRRICSEADIADVVGRFQFSTDQPIGLQLESVEKSAPADQSIVFCEYERNYQYPEQYPLFQGAAAARMNTTRTLWLIFQNDHTPELYDRIVFVISWLRQQYPEFAWKGGYRR